MEEKRVRNGMINSQSSDTKLLEKAYQVVLAKHGFGSFVIATLYLHTILCTIALPFLFALAA